jgi:Protein of unknown function (DUF1573)
MTMHIRPFLLALFAAVSVQAAPVISSPAKTWEGGEYRIGTKVQHTFTIQNTGDQPLKISEVKPGCGCTTANLAKSKLLPGESTEIAATLDLAMRRGKQDKTIDVLSNDPKQPRFQLLMRVLSKDDFELDPPHLDLGQVVTGVELTRKATLRVLSEQPYKITELVPVKNIVKATWESSPDSKTHTITVVIPPQTAAGTFFDNVQIRTDNKDSPMLPLQVVGTIQAGITLSAMELSVKPGEANITRNVTVRGGSVKTFTVLDAKLDEPGVTVDVLPPTVFGQQIRVKFATVNPGVIGKDLIIRTDAPGFAEVRVPVKAAAPATTVPPAP